MKKTTRVATVKNIVKQYSSHFNQQSKKSCFSELKSNKLSLDIKGYDIITPIESRQTLNIECNASLNER